MKLNWNLITYITIVVMVICLAIAIFWYNTAVIDKCTSNPLVYGAKQLTEQYSYEFEGYGWFRTPLGIPSPKVYFNHENLTIE